MSEQRDIVETLRWGGSFGASGNLWEQAADEICTLRTQVESAVETLKRWRDENEVLRAQLAGCGGDVKACTSDVPCAFGALAQIESLRAQLEGCKEMFAHTAERANEYVKAFQHQENKLASARNALEPFAQLNLWTDSYPDGPKVLTDPRAGQLVKYDDVVAARAALTDEQR